MGEKKGFFKRLVEGLTKTRDNIVSGIDSIFNGFSNIRCFVISYTREKTLKFIGCVLGDLFAVDFVAR